MPHPEGPHGKGRSNHGNAVGLMECDSVPWGYICVDAAAKSAEVRVVQASPICPGRFFVIISGRVAAVQAAMNRAVAVGGGHVLSQGVLANIAEAVVDALLEPHTTSLGSAVGVIETLRAAAAITGADAAVKAAQVELLEVRLTRGMGGKSFVVMAGTVSAVTAGVESGETQIAPADLVTAVVLPAPHPALLAQFPG